MLRTHACGELTPEHVDQTVTVAGWVHRRRDHGGLIFIDLRDRQGILQIVFNPEIDAQSHQTAAALRTEYVIMVTGTVARRPPGTENPRLPTGEIELIGHQCTILNPSRTPPFYINEEDEVEENLRLRYRYLDLRRQRMQQNMMLRHRVIRFLRDFLDARGFVEIETPILIKSTPEGARDFLVPSRLQAGRFFALPQSPQQLKQLLMVAGFEKYYQVARCFRDEDLRADRQPEFTQLDIEMSFVDEEDILQLLEEMFTSLVETVKPSMKIVKPFPRLTYQESMERYGSDKPDMRFGLEFHDLSELAAACDFTVFREAVREGGWVKGICAPGCAHYTRKQLDELMDLSKSQGAKGLVTLAIEETANAQLVADPSRSFVAKFFTPQQVGEMASRFGARGGDLLLIVADRIDTVNKALGQLRVEMGRRLGFIDEDTLAFLFIVDYPLLEWNVEEGRWEPMHHPFTAPQEQDIPLLDTAPQEVKARHYDIVCNGSELSSGSIRIHNRQIQEKVFQLLGYSQTEVEQRFGQLLEAFEYGAPPHGGIAPGIDRLVMLLAGEQNIREVIPFPKTQSGYDPLFDAPSEVSEEQLSDLHLALRGE